MTRIYRALVTFDTMDTLGYFTQPGEPIELNDDSAIILLNLGAIAPLEVEAEPEAELQAEPEAAPEPAPDAPDAPEAFNP